MFPGNILAIPLKRECMMAVFGHNNAFYILTHSDRHLEYKQTIPCSFHQVRRVRKKEQFPGITGMDVADLVNQWRRKVMQFD